MKLTLCGSARFLPSFEEWNQRLTCGGHIVYSLGVHFKLPQHSPDKSVLDLVHLKKISESEGIVILNDEDYIGESTKNEVLWACLTGKRLFATTQPNQLRDWGIGQVVVFPAQALLGGTENVQSWTLCETIPETCDLDNFHDKLYPNQGNPLGEAASNGSIRAVLTPDEAKLIKSIRDATGQLIRKDQGPSAL